MNYLQKSGNSYCAWNWQLFSRWQWALHNQKVEIQLHFNFHARPPTSGFIFFCSVSGETLMGRLYSSLSGGELFERITAEGYTLSEAEVINYMRQICEGVKHMHERNIIHLGKQMPSFINFTYYFVPYWSTIILKFYNV